MSRFRTIAAALAAAVALLAGVTAPAMASSHPGLNSPRLPHPHVTVTTPPGGVKAAPHDFDPDLTSGNFCASSSTGYCAEADGGTCHPYGQPVQNCTRINTQSNNHSVYQDVKWNTINYCAGGHTVTHTCPFDAGSGLNDLLFGDTIGQLQLPLINGGQGCIGGYQAANSDFYAADLVCGAAASGTLFVKTGPYAYTSRGLDNIYYEEGGVAVVMDLTSTATAGNQVIYNVWVDNHSQWGFTSS